MGETAAYDASVVTAKSRPVFSKTLGATFERLRADYTSWSQNHAAARAEESGLPGISRNIIWRLEQGRIKHPSAETLRSIAQLYGADYPDVVRAVTECIYGSELSRHTGRLPSPGQGEGEPDANTVAARALAAAREEGRREALAEIRDAASAFADEIASRVSREDGTTREGKTQRRRVR